MDRRQGAWAACLVVAMFVVSAATLGPDMPRGGRSFIEVPDDGGCTEATLAPGATSAAGGKESCEGVRGGSGGGITGTLASVVPLIALVVAGILVIVATGAFLVLRFTPRAVPEPGGGWWSCAACGASNLTGSPRCYKCGAWQPSPEGTAGRSFRA